jgi:hypothetical protein
LKIVPLDAAGAPTAAPIMITKPDAHVLAYDVVPFGEGTLLAWRDDPTTLGAEAPLIHLATVSAAGSVKTEVIEDASLAAGTPKLFVDVASKSEPRVWLSAMGNGGKPRMGFFDGSGELAAPLEEVTLLGINEPLALHGGKFLLGRPNGRALDLSVVGCGLLSGASGKF